MASQIPIVRQVAWLRLLPIMGMTGVLCIAGWLLAGEAGVFIGFGAFVAYQLLARFVIARHHRRGIRLVRRHQFADAVGEFEQSLAFFSQHPWIDRFRSIVLLSAGAMGYREMALVNIAFCYSQIGRGAEAKEYYQRALSEFPDNGIAQAALKLIESGEQMAVR
jgi:tetratricopeptide (TPR) repeat protein